MRKTPSVSTTLALAGELRVVASQLKRRLREQAIFGDLTLAQVSILHRLENEGPTTVTALARVEGMRPQSMGANMTSLQSADLVGASADPNDGRQTLWQITAACRAWIKAGRSAREDWLFRTLQQTLTPGEQAQLSHALTLLKRVVDN